MVFFRWLRRPRRDQAPRLYPGIELRIRVGADVIFQEDSESLHLRAKYRPESSCNPACLPRCRQHGWMRLIPSELAGEGVPGLQLEVRPVTLLTPPDLT